MSSTDPPVIVGEGDGARRPNISRNTDLSPAHSAYVLGMPVELASILITDLVGSTGLESRVGPAQADTLRREHFDVLREAIEACDGREVKNLGDGLMVSFASSSGAVRCAVRMQQLMERRNRSVGRAVASADRDRSR